MATKKKAPEKDPGAEKTDKKKKATIVVDMDTTGKKLKKAIDKLAGKKSHDPNDEPILYEDKIGNKIEIVSAEIKDEFCNYTYRVKDGNNQGDEHKVKGKGIVDPDMRDAFARLRVHLANIDDAFLLSGITINKIQELTSDEITQNYVVTGIKIKGGSDSELVSLVGNKYCTSATGRIHLETPLIAIDNLSSYKFADDLRECVNEARKEVAEYMNGKFTIPEPVVDDKKQLKITDIIDAQEKKAKDEQEQRLGDESLTKEDVKDNNGGPADGGIDFETAKID